MLEVIYKMENSKEARQSNFELLRILAMFLIVLHHFSVHGNFPIGTGNIYNDRVLQICGLGGGVEIFIMLSGYFLINSRFKLHKLIKLMVQCLFYGGGIVLFSLIILKVNPSKDLIVKGISPFGQLSWFAYAYIILYIFFPFFNVMFKHLGRKMHLLFILTGFVVWLVIPTFTNFLKHFSLYFDYSELVRFVYFYSMGAYFRLYGCKVKLKTLIILLIGVICYIYVLHIVRNFTNCQYALPLFEI